MFKTILRTLSAFSIVIITASAGFAQSTPAPVDCKNSNNQNLPECKVVFSDWVRSFGNTPPPFTPDTDNPRSQFLRNIESAQTNENIDIFSISEEEDYYTSLNLKKATFNTMSLEGEEGDGLAAFYGRTRGQSGYNFYSGIFSTTDLGAPLTKETGIANWVGRFTWAGWPVEDFVLEVNFADKNIEAFVVDIGRDIHNAYLKGSYDNNGVISGTVATGVFTDNNRYKLENNSSFSSTLTGLIGIEGAVGVFDNGGFVARPATDVNEAVSFLNGICEGDPFHEFCYLSDEREARITLCSTNDNALINTKCIADAIKDSCILHPFDDGCKPTAASHYQIARENRSAFCNDPANTGDNFDTLCKGAEHAALCSYDPFHRLCDNANGLYNDARKAVCKAGSSHPDCATDAYETSSNVTAISWLSSFYEDTGVVLPTEPDTIIPQDQFLQGTEGGIDNGDVEIRTYSGEFSDGSRSGDLNLNTATFDGEALDGDAADGVAYFEGLNYRGYGGILSGTDLGAPVTETSGTANWYGQFQADDGFKTDFTLEISFSARGTDGSVEAFVHRGRYWPYSSTNWYYLLEGKFDDNGVISGTVVRGIFANHDRGDRDSDLRTDTLTGLIGEEGAVGVFVGRYFSGGFVVSSKSIDVLSDPNVKFSDWVRIFGNTPPLPDSIPENGTEQTQFLQGTQTGFDSTAGYYYYPRQTMKLSDVNTGGEDADGVAYISETRGGHYNYLTNSYEPTIKYHYAGLLSGTNLGESLDSSVEANWRGNLGMIVNGTNVPQRSIILNVDFAKQGIAEGITIAYTREYNTHFVSFNGLKWDTNGVITGGITYNPGSALDNLDADSTKNSAGIVRGLIGQQGAVGAFKSYHGVDDDGINTPYVGGFVAVPNTVFSRVTFSDWVGSFDTPPSLMPDAAAAGHRYYQFLQGTESGVNKGHVEATIRANGQPRYVSLDLDTATFDGVALGGDAADGVAYFYGNDGRYYAGIFSGTDLGAPVTETSGTARWYGQFQLVRFKTDFTLEVNFNDFNGASTKTLKAFVHRDTDRYYLLDGYFDDNGVIGGTVVDGIFPNHDRISSHIRRKFVLTGLIGTDGAVGAFADHALGGFVAAPHSTHAFSSDVKFSDWVRSFYQPPYPTVPSDETEKTRFLQGTETGLSKRFLSDVVRPANNPLTLADVSPDGQSADGVDYMSGTHRINNRSATLHVAGVLSGTNLGAVLDTPVTADWSGKLGMIVDGSNVPLRDITLNIDFANTDIEIADTKTTANTHFVNFNNLSWDGNGVITGEMTYNPGAALDNLNNFGFFSTKNSTGIVRGLIGKQGAVGVFRSRRTLGTPSSTTPYVGGFVAAPRFASHVNWVNSFGTTGLPATANLAAPKNQFLQNGVATLRDSKLDGRFVATPINRLNGNATSSGTNSITLSGEATDGVAFAKRTREVTSDQTDYYYYAELSSTTNLGIPLSQTSGRATANGVFQFVDGKNVHNSAKFELKILFDDNGAGSIRALIPGTFTYNAFYLAGKFDVNGIIRGDITHNSHLAFDRSNQGGHGILTGLIGQQGTVGAFISDATGADGYAGGFVAEPHQTETSIDYLDWAVRSFDTPLTVNADTDAPKNQFLHGKTVRLSIVGFDRRRLLGSLTLAGTTPDGTSLGGEGADGVAFFRGTLDDTSGVAKHYYYAGLLSGTNLGAPITDSSLNGSWKGSFKFIDHTEMTPYVADLMLNVNFGDTGHSQAGSINASIPGTFTYNAFYLAGKFDVNGVIRGDIYHNSYIYNGYNPSISNHQIGHGILTGLIGQDGAVGAFISDGTGDTGYSGGFVARPPAGTASP